MVEEGEIDETSLNRTALRMIHGLQQNPRIPATEPSGPRRAEGRFRSPYAFLNDLTEVEHAALRMFYLERATLEEIEAATAITPSTVRRLLQRLGDAMPNTKRRT